MRRRDFVKFLTGGAAAAGIMGKDILKAAEVKDDIKVTGTYDPEETARKVAKEINKDVKKLVEKAVDSLGDIPLPTLRIAHGASRWVVDKGVPEGQFFFHNWGETEVLGVSNHFFLDKITLVGWRSMRFATYHLGSQPQNDKWFNSEDELLRFHFNKNLDSHESDVMWGPVYEVQRSTGWRDQLPNRFTLYCHNKSMRKWASNLSSENYHHEMKMIVNMHKARAGWKWYTPRLQVLTINGRTNETYYQDIS